MISLDTGIENVRPNTKKIWHDCLKLIKKKIPAITFNTWFAPINPIKHENDILLLELPSLLFLEWVTGRYSSVITSSVEEVLGSKTKIEYVTMDEKFQDDLFTSALRTQTEKADAEKKERTLEIELKKENGFKKNEPTVLSNLNPKYTFENFIKGEGNQLARAAAGAISDNPGGTSFNPFFIYGGVGLGKTHLIQAIGNKIKNDDPKKRVIYVSSDRFTVEFVESIQANKANDFSNFYRSMDVLIIDDVQFLTGKEKTQDLFFHIFNALHQSGRQIILSSDKPPKDLKGMDDRLISRFNWGLNADIQPPDLETRIAILTKKSKDYGMDISQDILEFIATNIKSNIRELEGCLIKILADASLTSKEISIELAKKTVREISTSKKVDISIEIITKIVCEHFNVDVNKVREKTRKKEAVEARQVAMYLSKELTNSSLKTIGLHFGGRDHSTVIHSVNTISEMIPNSKLFKEKVDYIKNKIELTCS